MKKNKIIKNIITVVGSFALVSGATAAPNSNRDHRSASRPASAQQDATAGEGIDVRVTRASMYLGSDVISTDGRKVGDIVDYYFDLNQPSHLAYVVVMTGGFLEFGGDRRAVPASSITTTGDNCRINISAADFRNVPVLPKDPQRFVSDPQNQTLISRQFAHADSNSAGESQATNATSNNDANRAGAMTGRASTSAESHLVSYNDLRNADVYGDQGRRLGFFADAWINLNSDRAPYVEITSTFQPFRTNFDRRYAIPTAKIDQKREFYGYTVNVTTDELTNAEPVSETEGVKMLNEGRFGNTVLRVTVPQG